MTSSQSIERIGIEVQAVLSRLRMSADALAGLAPDDHLEIESEGGAGLVVQLSAAGITIATASLEVIDGRLIATILNHGPGAPGRRIDQWKHLKATTKD